MTINWSPHHRYVFSIKWVNRVTHRVVTCLLVLNSNILTYISSINTWASGDSRLAQLVKELDLCLFLCVIRRLQVRDTAEPINNFSLPTTEPKSYPLVKTRLFWNSNYSNQSQEQVKLSKMSKAMNCKILQLKQQGMKIFCCLMQGMLAVFGSLDY